MTVEAAPFHIGDKVVYAMHGMGQVTDILSRTVEGISKDFFHVVLEKNKGEVLVPMEQARALGLRHAMRPSEVPQVVRQLQQPAVRAPKRGQLESDYRWCKERLRQESALGLAEVRRFLHELEHIESFSSLHIRQLRTYVYAQLPLEMAQALKCHLTAAERLVDTALTSKRPVVLPAHPDMESVG
jgi:CarD family transcriptional regulator